MENQHLDDIELQEIDEFSDETDAEREARLATEVILDEKSKTFVSSLIERLMVVCETMSGHPFHEYQKPFARRGVNDN